MTTTKLEKINKQAYKQVSSFIDDIHQPLASATLSFSGKRELFFKASMGTLDLGSAISTEIGKTVMSVGMVALNSVVDKNKNKNYENFQNAIDTEFTYLDKNEAYLKRLGSTYTDKDARAALGWNMYLRGVMIKMQKPGRGIESAKSNLIEMKKSKNKEMTSEENKEAMDKDIASLQIIKYLTSLDGLPASHEKEQYINFLKNDNEVFSEILTNREIIAEALSHLCPNIHALDKVLIQAFQHDQEFMDNFFPGDKGLKQFSKLMSDFEDSFIADAIKEHTHQHLRAYMAEAFYDLAQLNDPELSFDERKKIIKTLNESLRDFEDISPIIDKERNNHKDLKFTLATLKVMSSIVTNGKKNGNYSLSELAPNIDLDKLNQAYLKSSNNNDSSYVKFVFENITGLDNSYRNLRSKESKNISKLTSFNFELFNEVLIGIEDVVIDKLIHDPEVKNYTKKELPKYSQYTIHDEKIADNHDIATGIISGKLRRSMADIVKNAEKFVNTKENKTKVDNLNHVLSN